MHLYTSVAALLLWSHALALPSVQPLLPRENRGTPLKVVNPSNPKIPLRLLPFDGTSCDPSSRRFLIEHFNQALTIVDNVLDTATTSSIPFRTFFRDDPDNPHLEASTLKSVLKTFTNIKKLLTDKNIPWKITCGNTACETNTMAWCRVQDQHLNFCSDIFHYKTLGAMTEFKRMPTFNDLKCKPTTEGTLTLDTTAARLTDGGVSQVDVLGWLPVHTILHELSHMFYVENNPDNHIADCFYGAYAAEFLAIHHPTAAVANADNYAWFALTQYLNTLCDGDTDTVYYRAWKDKRYFLQVQTFKYQFDNFNKLKAEKLKWRGELGNIRNDLHNFQNDMIEAGGNLGRSLLKNGLPVDMTVAERKRFEGLKKRVEEAGKKLTDATMKLDGYTETTCDVNVGWQEVVEVMDKRPVVI